MGGRGKERIEGVRGERNRGEGERRIRMEGVMEGRRSKRCMLSQ